MLLHIPIEILARISCMVNSVLSMILPLSLVYSAGMSGGLRQAVIPKTDGMITKIFKPFRNTYIGSP